MKHKSLYICLCFRCLNGVMLMVTVSYHSIMAILKACKMYDRAREKINGLFERKHAVMGPIELDESTTNTTISYGLRKQLCED